MWQTDTEQSEALEQMGAKRSDVLVNFKKPMSHLSHVPCSLTKRKKFIYFKARVKSKRYPLVLNAIYCDVVHIFYFSHEDQPLDYHSGRVPRGRLVCCHLGAWQVSPMLCEINIGDRGHIPLLLHGNCVQFKQLNLSARTSRTYQFPLWFWELSRLYRTSDILILLAWIMSSVLITYHDNVTSYGHFYISIILHAGTKMKIATIKILFGE